MKKLIKAENSDGQAILVDLNDLVLNPAGTNMTIATYPDNGLNKRNKKPVYEHYKSLKLLPKDKETVEELFKLKAKKMTTDKKAKKTLIRKDKKAKKTAKAA